MARSSTDDSTGVWGGQETLFPSNFKYNGVGGISMRTILTLLRVGGEDQRCRCDGGCRWRSRGGGAAYHTETLDLSPRFPRSSAHPSTGPTVSRLSMGIGAQGERIFVPARGEPFGELRAGLSNRGLMTRHPAPSPAPRSPWPYSRLRHFP